jgi:gamma-glutamyl-gamma-aminobutyrate hydrolase PuuD
MEWTYHDRIDTLQNGGIVEAIEVFGNGELIGVGWGRETVCAKRSLE